jgi:hypothetical protein
MTRYVSAPHDPRTFAREVTDTVMVERDTDGTRRMAWDELDAEQRAQVRRQFLDTSAAGGRAFEAYRYEIGRDGRTILSRKPAAQCGQPRR